MKTVPELRAELDMLYAERKSRQDRDQPVSWINYVIEAHEAQLESMLETAPGPDMEPERTGTYGDIPWWGWALLSAVALAWVAWAV